MELISSIYCDTHAEHQRLFLQLPSDCPVLSDALLIGVFADGHHSNLYSALLLEDVPPRAPLMAL